jgi:hypothetical protein
MAISAVSAALAVVAVTSRPSKLVPIPARVRRPRRLR